MQNIIKLFKKSLNENKFKNKYFFYIEWLKEW